MAPEQAAGDYREVGVQSDVYSLGVILYELLVGEPPFAGHNAVETLRKIHEHQLPPTALRRCHTPRDLETICLKCLEREQVGRYQSARDLAEDLRRYLAGEAVSARAIGSGERFVRWCRRNRVVAALGASVLVTMIAGTAVSSYYALAAHARAREAQIALTQARNAVDDSLTVLSEQRLLNEPGMQPLRRELLSTALRYYEDFVRDHAGDLGLEGELAHACVRAAGIHTTLGEHARAEPLYRKAIEIRESLARLDPTSDQRRRELADAYNSLATWQNWNRRTSETEPLFLKAIAIREKLTQTNPLDAGDQSELAVSYSYLSELYNVVDGWTEAEAPLRRATEIRERLALEYPDVPRYQSDLAVSYHALAILQKNAGRRAESEQFFRKAIEIHERLVSDSPTPDSERELAKSRKHLAVLQRDTGRLEEAAESFKNVLEVHERLARENPTTIRHPRDLAACYSDVAKLRAVMGDDDEAENYFRKAVDLQERLIAIDPAVAGYHRQLAGYCKDLTLLLTRRGRTTEALKSCGKVCEAWEAITREEPMNRKYWSHLAKSYLWRAEISVTDQGGGEVETLYHRAIELYERLVRETPCDAGTQAMLAEAYEGQAISLERLGQSASAVQDYRKAIEELPGTKDEANASQQQQCRRATLHARLALQLALSGGDEKDVVAGEIRRASALAPGDTVIQLLCVDALGLTGAWREAADFQFRAEIASDQNWWIMLHRPRLLLAAGDMVAY